VVPSRLVTALLTAIILPACGPARLPAAGAPLPTPAAAAAAAAGPVAVGTARVELLADGAEAMARMVALVAAARARVEAEIYEFDRRELVEAMVAARRRGVAVAVVADPTVSTNAKALDRLRAAGAEVRLFPTGAGQIDHVKLLVVDGLAAVFGGMNWGSRSYLNHDFDVAVTGTPVALLDWILANDLVRSGNVELRPPARPPDDPGLRLATTHPAADIRPLVLEAIGAARAYVFVEMYVITDGPALAALEQAARRGVATWILLDPGQPLNQAAAVRLREARVAVRFYHGSGEKLHAKAMVVDGGRLLVGSANWTSSGFGHNHELDALIDSPEVAAAALRRMEADWAVSA
jgi:cardiolipin synthase